MQQLTESRTMCAFGECVMSLASKRGITTQAALRRALLASGADVRERTLANYLYGRTVVDPALPNNLTRALKLNKREQGDLALSYTFGQPARGAKA